MYFSKTLPLLPSQPHNIIAETINANNHNLHLIDYENRHTLDKRFVCLIASLWQNRGLWVFSGSVVLRLVHVSEPPRGPEPHPELQNQ